MKLLTRLFLPVPWTFVAVALVAMLIQSQTSFRAEWVFHRQAIFDGEWWRLWTGHLVHFGWPHTLVDVGLFLLIGRFLEPYYPISARISLVLAPLVIAGTILLFDPQMAVYGGLSGLNVAFLVFLCCRGWQAQKTDWFWPAMLFLHVAEIAFEVIRGGEGGGAIAFDDPTIRVATIAHVGGAVYGIVWWLALLRRPRVAAEGTPQAPPT